MFISLPVGPTYHIHWSIKQARTISKSWMSLVLKVFALLDRQGNEEGNVVGRLPRQYLVENVNALAAGKQSIPHA
ncbi:hypothetical protein YC2023_007471 [Brassica napus]